MANEAQKLSFAQGVQNLANQLAKFQDAYDDAAGIQTTKGWATTGSDPIVDSDVESLGITAAQLNSFLSTLRTRFDQLMGGQTVSAVVAGRSITDAMRSDLS